MRRHLLPLAVLALLPATASAATPESGTVSAGTPKAEWTGTIQNGYLFHNSFNYEPQAGTTGTLPCESPGCDTFTLENADGTADLLLEVASEQSPDISLRIQDPSGTWTYYDGWSDGAPATKVRLKKAAKGSYVINIVARVFGSTNPTAVTDTADYRASATLAIAPPPVAVPAPAAAPPAPAPSTKKPPARKKKPSARAACQKKAKRIKNKRKRKAALKRCAKKRRR